MESMSTGNQRALAAVHDIVQADDAVLGHRCGF
jgi:hypothetical protein